MTILRFLVAALVVNAAAVADEGRSLPGDVIINVGDFGANTELRKSSRLSVHSRAISRYLP